MIFLGLIAAFAAAFTGIAYKKKWGPFSIYSKVDMPHDPEVPVIPPTVPPASAPEPEKLDWSTRQGAYHATRVLCDNSGLFTAKTILVNGQLFAPKDIICACIFQESGFLKNPKPNQNIDEKTGKVWSTDYGIVQVNDYYHIGQGKDFPSVEYVLDNPEACVQWMINIYKRTIALQPWSSYSSGAYKKHLIPTSPMWALAK